ncbi:cell morphogenesis protein-like protein [Tothia fuscella]|uniref:Cell morphogenesis protein-like protein n=1 Tax=Tothia fuscella TaxID=1048955 RepID=A0A9P4NN80_9PEZI|nr:cell morphogenesis protein-like protein [Tothia fuscella]
MATPQGQQRAESLSHHNAGEIPAIAPALPSAAPKIIPSREPSLLRGRAVTAKSTRGGSTSRSQTPAANGPGSKLTTVAPLPLDGGSLERKVSGNYGHHRQASVVHGSIQHSRNTSFASTPSTSPITPQTIAGVGVGQYAIDSRIMAEDGVGSLPLLNGHTGTTSKGHSPSTSFGDRMALENIQGTSFRRGPERMYSGRTRKEHNHTRSQSRGVHTQQVKEVTVGEYALHHLFNSFIALAEQKISQCLSDPRGGEPRVESICGPDIDPAFDQLIKALGHIARQKPKPLIDTLMLWRKGKSEAANAARNELAQAKSLTSMTSLQGPTAIDNAITLQQAVIQAERRSTVSIYLLCRVLMEIFAQSTLIDVTPEMADRLEDIIYKQLSAADPDYLEESPFRQSNWVIFGQLLGAMSELDFENVTGRFINDLEKMQLHVGARREAEGRAVLVIRGLRWMRIKFTPEPSWNRSCDFMLALAKLAINASGQTIKYAYNTLFKELLLPLAANATSELNLPRWKGVIDTLKPKLVQMLTKPKHWHNAFPVLSVVLCASPHETFATQWLTLVLPLQSKLKERGTRAVALRGICRMVWTYLYRTCDSQLQTTKNLHEIIRLVFIPGRKSYISTDPAIAEPLIQLIRIIGYKYQEVCFKTILFPLMNSEMFTSNRELRIVDLEPEKIVIGIRAFLAIMTDLENGEQPPFPVTFHSDPSLEPFQVSSMPLSPRPNEDGITKTTLTKEERLSRPVMVAEFSEVTKDSYSRFCKILGEITLLCDNAFGGQAVLNEKFSSQTPKTPMAEAFSFARRDDLQTPSDARQGFYDLLHVAVQALPRCLSPHISFKSLINLLCTGTAHVQGNIAASSAQSIKSIARQAHAQVVTIGFARFIFNFDDRYATMSDGGMLGHAHIESTLRLYVELLEIWIEEIKQKTKRVATENPSDESVVVLRGAQLDLSTIWAHVDEVESHGLFFLCSPSQRVRTFAVTVLRLVTEFDTALGKRSERIIKIMEGSPEKVMDVNDEKLSVAERSRLQRGMRKSNLQSALVELCSSDVPYDSTLWFKVVFPGLIRLAFELCPFAVTLTREIICARISLMQKVISTLAEGTRYAPYSSFDGVDQRGGAGLAVTAPDLVIEQWKLYLIFACCTLTNKGAQAAAQGQSGTHTRKSSKSSQQNGEKVLSAGELFSRVIPFLAVGNPAVRDAVVVGLGSINQNLYRTLLECLQPAVVNCNEEAKIRIANHQRTISSPRRSRRADFLRMEVAHVYKLTSHFMHTSDASNDEWILTNLMNYTKDLRLFLNDAEIQNEWEFHKLRTHYCGLMEELYAGINRTKDPIRWMPFQARKAAFALMEDWCGYSPNQNQIRQREDSMRRSMLDREQEYGTKGIVTAAMEIEKRDLKTAALSAMASLCGGPVSITTDTKAHLQFDVLRMLSWIDTIFDTPSDKTHAIGRRALQNLIVHNKEHTYFLGRSIEMCYLAKSPKALESYFEVVTQVLMEREDFAPAFWKILCAGLYTLGNDNNQLRMKSARLLRSLEERQEKSSKLQDLDISISDKTIAVYKRAQFEASQRLAQQHSDLAFHVFSEFSRFFKDLQADHQRNMVAAMLPWVQTIELQLDPNGGPTATSYMLLVNLFEITVRCGNALHNEIQALWQALATGPYAGNVQLVLDFIITICLDKKEQNFVEFAKQIVVYLAGTPAGSKVVEFLQLQITPKAMVQDKGRRQTYAVPPEASTLPYLADLSAVLPGGNKQQGFSLGQLCLILLVDLMVAPTQLAKESVPLLLHVILILWDHYIPLVQDQAREMLVHLIHELVISQVEDDSRTIPTKRSIEDFIELIRRHEIKVVWTYDEFNGKKEDENDLRLPEAMGYVATEVFQIFSITYPTIREDWGKTALKWASNCPVHHLACRSFQVFRSVLSSLDQPMLADMLARLSNTIADDGTEVQTFSMEILSTLKTIIDALTPADLVQYPQLFWTTCACLDTIHEREFVESLAMLEKLMEKLDLSDPAIVLRLSETFPPKWESSYEGLSSLVYKGVRSSICLDRSLRILEKLVVLPSNELIGDESRFLFTLLANLPRFLRMFETNVDDAPTISAARTLAKVADRYSFTTIAASLRDFANQEYLKDDDFLGEMLPALKSTFFPDNEFRSLVFMMSLLTNKLSWFKIKTMHLLCVIIPDIDMRKTEIATKGPDLISPLLRLLQTEYCPQTLAVLDNVMTMTATPLDNKHLRMSMAGANTSRALRKEYEKVQSLYGIPEESGWSIPVPAAHAATTRANVHAVFYTCASSELPVTEEETTPQVELVNEEYGSSYLPDYRTATMMSDDTRDNPPGDLVMKLESLDDFFDDDDVDMTPTSAVQSSLHHYSGTTADVRESLYDQQTFPILHKSLKRNASVGSFHTGFADLRISPSREAMIMSPGAFGPTSVPQQSHGLPARPGMHTRSVTSPAANAFSPPGTSFSLDETIVDEEAFSDDDFKADFSRGGRDEKPFALEHIIRPNGGGGGGASGGGGAHHSIRSGFRSGIRRLTGGAADAEGRKNFREGLKRSPQVPKVPDVYLRDPKSSDL